MLQTLIPIVRLRLADVANFDIYAYFLRLADVANFDLHCVFDARRCCKL